MTSAHQQGRSGFLSDPTLLELVFLPSDLEVYQSRLKIVRFLPFWPWTHLFIQAGNENVPLAVKDTIMKLRSLDITEVEVIYLEYQRVIVLTGLCGGLKLDFLKLVPSLRSYKKINISKAIITYLRAEMASRAFILKHPRLYIIKAWYSRYNRQKF